ncbi:MAG: glycosyltransferase family 2 protein [Thermodesulfovibrionales bacterium]|nr:glycosyltransferase family 2 protein [Thermodesulfovibrionales bacterium]
MDLSVIIINWNTRDLLINCVKSIYKTTKGISYEIIVVDNGSSDGSVKALKEQFPEVMVIENNSNLGFAKACNQAIRKINSRYAVFLNTDAFFFENTLRKALEFMDENLDVAICGAQLLNEDGSKQNSISSKPSLLTELINKSILKKLYPRLYFSKEINIENPIEVDSVIGAFMIVRKEAIDDVGLLDENFFFFFEETDWCLMMQKKGWKVFHHPQLRVYHLQGQTAKKVHIPARIEYWRSRYIFFKKHYGERHYICLKVGLVVKLLLNLILNLALSVITLFRYERVNHKVILYYKILQWHLLGLPDDYGLKNKVCL